MSNYKATSRTPSKVERTTNHSFIAPLVLGLKKGQQTPCGKEIANYTKLSNVTLTKGIAVMASAELSFIEESGSGDSRGR